MPSQYSGRYKAQAYMGNVPIRDPFELYIDDNCTGGTFTINNKVFKLDQCSCDPELSFQVTVVPETGGYEGIFKFEGNIVIQAPKIIWGPILTSMGEDPTWTAQATPGTPVDQE